MKEDTLRKLKKSAKPALFALLRIIGFVIISPKFVVWLDKAIPLVHFLLIAIAYGTPVFAAYRAMQPWLEEEK